MTRLLAPIPSLHPATASPSGSPGSRASVSLAGAALALGLAALLGACDASDPAPATPADASSDADAREAHDTPGAGDAADTALDASDDVARDDAALPVDPWIEEIRALGVAEWMDDGPAPTLESEEGNVTTHVFDTDAGPLCLRGDPFRFSVRETGHPNLVIFLQGGGACWSEFCLAVRKAPAGIPGVDALRTDLDANPLRDWNVVYLPYCDGSLFAGDRDHDDDGDGTPDRFHRGIHNLSGALRTARERFPAPERVVLTGSSAGGFGTILAVLLVRVAWPGVPIDVVNDSGVGVARPGDVDYLATLLDEFAIDRFIPDSCVGCLDDGHIAPLIGWTLDRDPDLRVAVFSSWYDSIIASTFLQIDPGVFRDALRDETDRLHEAHPERYRRFFIDGITHTAMLGDPTGIVGSDLRAVELPPGFLNQLSTIDIGGLERTRSGEITFGEWLRRFVEQDEGWDDRVEEPGPWEPAPDASAD